MQHRMSNSLGFGGGYVEDLKNNVKLDDKFPWDEFYNDAKNSFCAIKMYSGFDYQVEKDSFRFGIEPSYKDDPYLCIKFDFTQKEDSWLCRGRAFGWYGSKVGKVYKFYRDYTRKNKFVPFIDKWYAPLKEWVEKQEVEE